jgi:hypothetical protein
LPFSERKNRTTLNTQKLRLLLRKPKIAAGNNTQ